MGDARFVEDADCLLVDHGQARITPAFVFVQCHLVGKRPGHASVGTYFYGNMVTSLRRVRVGENQQVFPRDVVFSVHVDEACHTNRFLQGTAAGRMFIPGLAQIAGGGHGAAASPGCHACSASGHPVRPRLPAPRSCSYVPDYADARWFPDLCCT